MEQLQFEIDDINILTMLAYQLYTLENETNFSTRVFESRVKGDKKETERAINDVANHHNIKFIIHLIAWASKEFKKNLKEDITVQEIKDIFLEETKKLRPKDEERKSVGIVKKKDMDNFSI